MHIVAIVRKVLHVCACACTIDAMTSNGTGDAMERDSLGRTQRTYHERVNAHHSRRQRDRAMRTDTLWNVSTGILADVARAARKRAYVAQGIGV